MLANALKDFSALHELCKSARTSFIAVLVGTLFFRLFRRLPIIPHKNVRISGKGGFNLGGALVLGLGDAGFVLPNEPTRIINEGVLYTAGKFAIGRGSTIEIADGATLKIGTGGYINARVRVICTHGIEIGDRCAISWDCQFLDNDFHSIDYSGKMETDNRIVIGNHVWIGCNTHVYKGSRIPDGCVVASDSVVKGVFTEENALIAGNPARVIKSSISWKLSAAHTR